MTDETAKAVLSKDAMFFIDVGGFPKEYEDIRAMAKFWLMLPDIKKTLEYGVTLDADANLSERLLAKIKELG